MFNVNKNYAELAYRQTKAAYIPRFVQRHDQFLRGCYKMCPKCGQCLPLSAKGCDSCLLQFDNGVKKCSGKI